MYFLHKNDIQQYSFIKEWTEHSPFTIQFSSVHFSCSVVSDFLQPHKLQHARPPCLSPTPGVHPNSCKSSWWCHPAISSSVVPFPSCPQSFPPSGSFPVILVLLIRWPKYWSFSISPSDEYSGFISFRIDWFGLLAVRGTLKNLLQHHNLKISILWQLAFFLVQYPVHDHWRNHSFD